MDKLKPCPFCGKEAINYSPRQSGGLYECEISCRDRYATFDEIKGKRCLVSPSVIRYSDNLREAKEKVIKAWNTRPNPWHTGQPTEDGLYRVLWLDTDEDIKRYSDLFWNSGNDTWYDEVTPDCNWGDEWHAEVIAWMPFEPYKEG